MLSEALIFSLVIFCEILTSNGWPTVFLPIQKLLPSCLNQYYCYYVWWLRPYEMKIVNQTIYSFDENYPNNATLHPDGSLDININYLKAVSEIYCHCELYLDSGSGKYEMEVINRTVNMCRLYRDMRYEPFIQIFNRIVLQYGNFPNKCPIEKKHYYIKKFQVDTEKLPPNMPEKKAFLRLTYFDGKSRKIGGFVSYIQVSKKYQSN